MFARILLFICSASVSLCSAQTAGELNKQAKDLLAKGETKKALPMLKKAAEMGHAEAQFSYGYCIQYGIETQPNDSIANIWYLKSANQGWVDAQFKIAYSYASGQGIKKDLSKAFYWAHRCAKQNDVECMFNIITSYQQGIGVPKNIDSSLAWAYRLGAMKETKDVKLMGMITSTRANLAHMYWKGDKVKRDLRKSYQWFLIYNENKRDLSALEQQKNIDIIKEIESKIVPADRAKAKQDAENLLGRPLKNLANIFKPDL